MLVIRRSLQTISQGRRSRGTRRVKKFALQVQAGKCKSAFGIRPKRHRDRSCRLRSTFIYWPRSWNFLRSPSLKSTSAEDGQSTRAPVAISRRCAHLNPLLLRSALDVLQGNALTDALGGVSEPLRQIAQAEAQLRQMLKTPGASFAEMERVAVLSGNAPLGPGSQAHALRFGCRKVARR